MVTLLIKTPGSFRRHSITAPDNIEQQELQKRVSELTGLDEANLSLIVRGKPLQGQPLGLADNDIIFAVIKAKPQARPKRQYPGRHGVSAEPEEEEEEDDLAFEVPESSSGLQNRVATFLRRDLRCPDVLLIVFFWFSLRTWLLIIIWFCMAPVMQYYLELGPIYILSTGFALIFFNLGTRRPGEDSAYSIFNQGFRELPGTLNADRLDRDIRAGQF